MYVFIFQVGQLVYFNEEGKIIYGTILRESRGTFFVKVVLEERVESFHKSELMPSSALSKELD